MNRLQWREKWRRLRGMSNDEILYRAREKVRVETERIRMHCGFTEREEKLPPSFRGSIQATHGDRARSYLREVAAQRFYLPADPETREALRQFVAARFPEWMARATEEAGRLCSHRMEILGLGELDLGREIDWHRDPVTGRNWPRRFWSDYDLVGGHNAGDPKCVHELNRHQHLPRLAKAYFLTRDEAYAREAIRQMRSWIEQNPPGIGIHWHSSLEIGLRALSWLWTIFFLVPSKSLDEDAAMAICRSLLAQLEHVYRYPSIFSSPNTHLLGEAAALFIGGTVFSEHAQAPSWRESGASLLVREMDRQVSSEGVHGELSSYYHCYTLDFYLQAMVLANRNRYRLPGRMWRKLVRMTEFVMHLSRPDGSIPLLGDDDGGRALALNRTSYRSFSDALCSGAILFERPEFKHQAGEFCEETFWMLGEPGWQTYSSLESTPPAKRSAFFPADGYFFQRSGWDRRACHLTFDCGGMGIINGGHGHADSLAIELFANGKEILVDPGTYTYNGSAEWRNYFRSTRAHNTAVVDGRDQSEARGTFRWNRPAQSRLTKQILLSDIEYLEGEHYGYARRSPEITHRRRVLYCRPDYWVIADDFRGQGEHDFDLYYHFGSEVGISCDGRNDAKAARDVLAHAPGSEVAFSFHGSVPFHTGIVRGQASPAIRGWISSRYGEKRPALVLRVNFHSTVPVRLISLILPVDAESAALADSEKWITCEPCRLAPAQAIGCMIAKGNCRDYVIMPAHGSQIEMLACKMQGDFFWLRTDRDALKQVFAVNAGSFEYSGRELLSGGSPKDCLSLRFDAEGRLAEPDKASEKKYVRNMRHCELQQR